MPIRELSNPCADHLLPAFHQPHLIPASTPRGTYRQSRQAELVAKLGAVHQPSATAGFGPRSSWPKAGFHIRSRISILPLSVLRSM